MVIWQLAGRSESLPTTEAASWWTEEALTPVHVPSHHMVLIIARPGRHRGPKQHIG